MSRPHVRLTAFPPSETDAPAPPAVQPAVPPVAGTTPRQGSDAHVAVISQAECRRPIWRRRLVDAERGLTEGFRGESAFFVHFFGTSVALAALIVLGATLLQWCITVLAIGVVLAGELFHRALVLGFEEMAAAGRLPVPAVRRVRRISTAAVLLTWAAAFTAILLIVAERIWMMFEG
jgi:diacylglycerol kinase